MEMNCVFTFFVLYNVFSVEARQEPMRINRIISLIQRRQSPILDVPEFPEDLPEAEPILPGHTLLKPARGMLKSAVKFLHRDYGNAAVYGNLDNLGITYGNKNERILYTNFRKANNVLKTLLNTLQAKDNSRHQPIIVLEIDGRGTIQRINKYHIGESEEEKDYRRRRNFKKPKNRNHVLRSRSDSSSEDSDSSENEKNPGNPYTIHKNKYKQNWLWNHFMDGDHMNVNPYAPETNVLGPSGPELFFGRKWWYFNQDDYKPMG